jgi:hypothetical protein
MASNPRRRRSSGVKRASVSPAEKLKSSRAIRRTQSSGASSAEPLLPWRSFERALVVTRAGRLVDQIGVSATNYKDASTFYVKVGKELDRLSGKYPAARGYVVHQGAGTVSGFIAAYPDLLSGR